MKRRTSLRRTPLRKQSAKRKAEWPKYLKERAEFLKENKFCEFPDGICVNRATELHHGKGRNGKYLRDRTFWWALCREHHRWLHDHGKEARVMGLIIDYK